MLTLFSVIEPIHNSYWPWSFQNNFFSLLYHLHFGIGLTTEHPLVIWGNPNESKTSSPHLKITTER